uniref:protein SMG7-like isoform X2 n=1 Tax=Fragaria vesca subsp. vesca TaxID=101020 RepID=UPI0005C95F48|nr:PREDICTED: protein SMG7-like isoform X2 [Fragaria vesca subsp. vesca]
MDTDGMKSADMKKGLISCHRCLIYLGDLACYKGLYGEGDSKTREYAAASSYYLQAASCWPSSGNPHHQLAILASHSGDEVVTVYRYFRSLVVDNPFSTARENLIVAFEKSLVVIMQDDIIAVNSNRKKEQSSIWDYSKSHTSNCCNGTATATTVCLYASSGQCCWEAMELTGKTIAFRSYKSD